MSYVVGCNHGIQPADSILTALDTPEQNEQRVYFRDMLAEIIAIGEIQIVCEEWGDVEQTAAHRLALRQGIPWRNINTSNRDKDRMGIPRDYDQGPYAEEQKNQWNRLRERFMLNRIIHYGENAQNALIICGFVHFEPLARLLAQHGTPVEWRDYKTLPWYRRGVFVGDL
jgi:hypothetical protein